MEIGLAGREGAVARIMGTFLEAGLLDPEDCATVGGAGDPPPNTVLERCISRIAGLDGTGPAFYALSLEIRNNTPNYYGQTEIDHRYLRLFFCVEDIMVAVIGRSLMRNCRGNIRAARDVLGCLEFAQHNSLHLFTPATAFDIAVMNHWRGEDGSRDFARALLEEGENPKDFEILRETELFRHMPRWAAQPFDGRAWKCLRGDPPERDAAPEDPLHPWRGRIDPVLLALCDRMVDDARAVSDRPIHTDDEDCFDAGPCFTSIVQWDDEDLAPRLFDDWSIDFQNAGGDHLAAIMTIDCETPDSLRSDVDRLLAHLRLIRSIDRLLRHLDQP